jgi:hypothetical protein
MDEQLKTYTIFGVPGSGGPAWVDNAFFHAIDDDGLKIYGIEEELIAYFREWSGFSCRNKPKVLVKS